MTVYRTLSLTLALIFAATGAFFLVFPDDVLALFNSISSVWGMGQSPVSGASLYLVLAVAYMYVVTVLAFLMFLRPEDRHFPILLINAKGASSLLSLALFVLEDRYLIYLANFIVDGAIGIAVLALYINARRHVWALS